MRQILCENNINTYISFVFITSLRLIKKQKSIDNLYNIII
jgi:hypothetical protein